MASWQEYLKLMTSLAKTLGDLTQVEQEKNAAVCAGDLAGVEACMKREQVLSLTLRGYDQKRDAMLAALGLKGVTARTMEDYSPEELRLETKKVSENLRRQYELFQTASKAVRNTLEVNLRAIEKTQALQAGDQAEAEEQRRSHQTDFRA